MNIENKELDEKWREVVDLMEKRFGEKLDLQSILFLIGVQELGKGYQKLNKDQKLDVIHIAVCTLLARYGYYEFEGLDADGWPHWKRLQKLPPLSAREQDFFMKEAVINFFSD